MAGPSSVKADTAFLHWLQAGSQSFELDNTTTILLTLLALVIVPTVASSLLGGGKRSKIPVANPPGLLETTEQKKAEFAKDGRRILEESRERYGGRPFTVLTNRGSYTVLPPERAQEIRNNTKLDFRKTISAETHSWMKGIDMKLSLNHPSEAFIKLLNKHLTKRLNTVTDPLAQECTFAVDKIFGDSQDWTDVTIYNAVLDLVARLSSRVFLGIDVCRNEEWLRITKSYTRVFLPAVKKIQGTPFIFKPFVYFTDPGCKEARRQALLAEAIIEPVIEKRRKESQQCAAKGLKPPVYNDSLQWAEEAFMGQRYSPGEVQVVLSVVAIHTTADLLTWTLLQLAANPQYIAPLREEIVRVLSAEGWKKTSLTNLKLLDSAVKEAQRMKPIHLAAMQRKVLADVELEGGLSFRKGEMLAVDNFNMMNPAIHKNAEKYDAYRFYEMRKQPGGENKNSLVSTSPEHIAFGHGRHACPGRFFAANEVKLALCHLLLKYDWELATGTTPKPVEVGIDSLVDPQARMRYRRRKEEIDLEALEVDVE